MAGVNVFEPHLLLSTDMASGPTQRHPNVLSPFPVYFLLVFGMDHCYAGVS